MTKYSKTITLETVDPYHPIKFTVSEANSIEDADNELNAWIKSHPELLKNENNKKILEWSLNGRS